MSGIAALALACLRHNVDASQPMSQMAEMLGAGVSEIRTAALGGVINMGKLLAAEAEADDELESTAAYEKLAPHVAALGGPIFKATKERNYNIRDLAVKSLAWLMQLKPGQVTDAPLVVSPRAICRCWLLVHGPILQDCLRLMTGCLRQE